MTVAALRNAGASWCMTFVLGLAPLAFAQGRIDDVKQLYADARYEEALDALHELGTSGGVAPSSTQAKVYRALCLLALDRRAEAEKTAEELISGDPLYQPVDVSPRLQVLVDEVRRRVLPSIVLQQYASGRDSFNRKAYEEATSHFNLVVTIVQTSPSLSQDSPTADVRTLAEGFLELMRASAPAAPPRTPAGPDPSPSLTVALDKDLTPPATLRQNVPPWTPLIGPLPPSTVKGLLEVAIDESGQVESATIVRSVHPAYDQLLLRAAKQWQYEPAMRQGVPVRYVKSVEIVLKGR